MFAKYMKSSEIKIDHDEFKHLSQILSGSTYPTLQYNVIRHDADEKPNTFQTSI